MPRSVDGILPVDKELFGILVDLVPGEVSSFDKLGEGWCGVAAGEAAGVGVGHVLSESFFYLPCVECHRAVVEGEEALRDSFAEVGAPAQAVVTGLEGGGAVHVLANGAVGGVESEGAGPDLFGEGGTVLEDGGRVGDEVQVDAVELGTIPQGVFRKETGHRDDHGLLALADEPAAQVVGEDQPLGVVAGVGGEAGLVLGDLTGSETVWPSRSTPSASRTIGSCWPSALTDAARSYNSSELSVGKTFLAVGWIWISRAGPFLD
ncbi:hypothetical protein K1Y78_47160 [Streptomyces sp. tea 10]|nr:hypothetical protein [Streptomyces sp. tea 10]